MFNRVRHFLARHPLVRDALLWAIPAIVFGAVIRALLLSYLPYAYWGADSKSYFGFAHKLLTEGYISLNEKRRFLYPIFLVPVSLLPGSPLRWLAVIQHLLGLGSLVPLAYIVRKTFVHWQLWIVPITVAFAGLPVIVWYEHELLGENVFFATLLWAFAGWCAWVGEARRDRALRLFWWFFVPFTLFILTKPSGRFVWPGIIAGFVLVAAWKRLDRRRIVALGVLAIVTLFVGSKKQGAWLFYTAVFPLTQLDTPLHAGYKAEIRDLVESMRARLDNYYTNDTDAFEFLERTDSDPNRPLWVELDRDEKKKSKVFMDLAIEAVKANPFQFVRLSVERAIASANVSDFDYKRFTSEYHRERVGDFYAEAEAREKDQVRFAFGLPAKGPIEPFAEFDDQLVPAPNSWQERTVISTVYAIAGALEFYDIPKLPRSKRYIHLMEPKPLAWWLLAATALSLLPRYRRTLGVWMIVAVGYELGVFLVSQHNSRYFAPVWPMVVTLLAVPADVLVQMIRRLFAARPPAT